MRILALGLLLCALVTVAACVAPDPTVTLSPTPSPVPAATPTPAPTLNIPATVAAAVKAALAATRAPSATTLTGGYDRSQGEVIDLSPSVTDSLMHADVGDRVVVQVDVSGNSQCKALKVRDPFGNVVAELTPKEIRSGGVQFRGAFFAAAAGEYVVELRPESKNLSCAMRSSAARAEVKWTVQPR